MSKALKNNIMDILNNLNESVEGNTEEGALNENVDVDALIADNVILEEACKKKDDNKDDDDDDEYELTEATRKVVRNGKVVTMKVKSAKKKKLTAKQKSALAKARKKSHSGSADKARAKSMKLRRKRLG